MALKLHKKTWNYVARAIYWVHARPVYQRYALQIWFVTHI